MSQQNQASDWQAENNTINPAIDYSELSSKLFIIHTGLSKSFHNTAPYNVKTRLYFKDITYINLLFQKYFCI